MCTAILCPPIMAVAVGSAAAQNISRQPEAALVEWRSLFWPDEKWSEGDCEKLAAMWYQDLGEKNRQKVWHQKNYAKGYIVDLKSTRSQVKCRHVRATKVFLKALERLYPGRACSTVYLADSLLKLDQKFTFLLFDRDTRLKQALREAAKIRRVWSAFRDLWRASFCHWDHAAEEFKNMWNVLCNTRYFGERVANINHQGFLFRKSFREFYGFGRVLGGCTDMQVGRSDEIMSLVSSFFPGCVADGRRPGFVSG